MLYILAPVKITVIILQIKKKKDCSETTGGVSRAFVTSAVHGAVVAAAGSAPWTEHVTFTL